MDEINIMRAALGSEWKRLPTALRAHYQSAANRDIGVLDVEYPRGMQPYLQVLRLFGVLVNRRGRNIPTIVEKHVEGGIQHWRRALQFPDGKEIVFDSRWLHEGGRRIVEYVGPMLGLCMEPRVEGEALVYEGRCFVVKLGRLRLRLPEWLVLGHTTIVERALDETHFTMDFRLRHPLFGELYRYSGTFTTQTTGSAAAAR